MRAFAAIYDNEIREQSSSGGIFTVLAQQMLRSGGVVYGVAMTDDCYGAEFLRVTDEGGLAQLRGSKYLQAKMNDTFRRVRADLEAGQRVLFSGTACQVNGLKLYLGLEYPGLMCVDVACHGVPSPELWKTYVQYRESQYGKLQSVQFRCKSGDATAQKNSCYIPANQDAYMRMFLRDYCLRPSCYTCRVKQDKKSDLTIADFWQAERLVPEMTDNQGISLVIARSEYGMQFFETVQNRLKWKEVSYSDAVRFNRAEYLPANRPQLRDMFFQDMNAMDFSELARKYAAEPKRGLKSRVKQCVKQCLRKINPKFGIKKDVTYGMCFQFAEKEL